MKQFIILLTAISTAGQLSSQEKVSTGYIITLKGDTLNGEIKFTEKSETELYKKVSFKEANTKSFKQYNPANILAYGYEDKQFETVKVEGQSKFLKVICRGDIMFYQYLHPADDEVFQAGESRYFMLKIKEDMAVEVFYDHQMKKELKKQLHDDAECVYEIEHAKKLNLEEVTSILNHYNINHKRLH